LTRGAVSARPGTWLCHNLCQLGATAAVAQFRGIGDWMRRNPTEVVTIVVQDGVEAAELAGTVAAAGLADLVATPPEDPGGTWPTLGEMVHDGRRLYIFTESQDLPGSYLRNFYRYASDTPFHNTVPADLDNCAVERGSADAPLLLVNHWLTDAAPNRREAFESNAADVVVKRAKLCESERGRLPTFVAVDFVSTGSLPAAVAHPQPRHRLTRTIAGHNLFELVDALPCHRDRPLEPPTVAHGLRADGGDDHCVADLLVEGTPRASTGLWTEFAQPGGDEDGARVRVRQHRTDADQFFDCVHQCRTLAFGQFFQLGGGVGMKDHLPGFRRHGLWLITCRIGRLTPIGEACPAGRFSTTFSP
jgi:hypothetical protein